ncbi:hypothetical protein [Domibacillus epiphyticus]|uniref:Uncharacterized protein n=1 Tax=Domibacillus epiphyticus TaxID=1714355 RepID=A0A1V2A5Q6_9BACI|nr:hypothetical protein [Domibacillus epiphyticus]OMP66323.1 hypothetical protein BTO28_12730 [Domibacillus epiphyticus]
MNNKAMFLLIDDYLDLYIYAKSMNDSDWQKEIIKKIQDFQQPSIAEKTQSLSMNELLEKYTLINDEIWSLFQQLRYVKPNSSLENQISELKKHRHSIYLLIIEEQSQQSI